MDLLVQNIISTKTLKMNEHQYESLPKEIKEILDSFDEDKDLYAECSRIQKELETKNYTCDYYLDGVIFDVKPIDNTQ